MVTEFDCPLDEIDPQGEWGVDPELKASMEAMGQLYPVLVGPRFNGRYPRRAGRGRYAVAKVLKWPTIRAGVKEGALPGFAARVALADNVRRKNDIATARSVKDLIEAGEDFDTIFKVSGLNKLQAEQHLALLGLADEHQQMMEAGKLSRSAARVLCRYPEEAQRQIVARAIADHAKQRVTAAGVLRQARKQRMIDQPPLPVLELPVSEQIDWVQVAGLLRWRARDSVEADRAVLEAAAKVLEGRE